MLNIVGIGGVPSAGKSTLFRALLEDFGEVKRYKMKTLRYMKYEEEKLIVLGVYGCGGFEGTDKLAMNVQPMAVTAIQTWTTARALDGWTVLFEGDRLFNRKFLQTLEGMKNATTKFVVLTMPEEELTVRQAARGNKQSPSWLKGRVTKVSNIAESMDLETWPNVTNDDLVTNKSRLRDLL